MAWADLAIWQQNYDPLGSDNNTWAMGDWNADSKIDGADLALWQQYYSPLGTTGIGASDLIISMGIEVPEPASALFALSGLPFVAALMRRKRRR